MNEQDADVIWALDQRDRCIACPAKPVVNAVVLHLAEDGSLARDSVGALAARGVMAAGVAWPGVDSPLSDDDWLDLEDAVTGLAGLASAVAVVGSGRAAEVARQLGDRVQGSVYADHGADLVEVLFRLAPI